MSFSIKPTNGSSNFSSSSLYNAQLALTRALNPNFGGAVGQGNDITTTFSNINVTGNIEGNTLTVNTLKIPTFNTAIGRPVEPVMGEIYFNSEEAAQNQSSIEFFDGNTWREITTSPLNDPGTATDTATYTSTLGAGISLSTFTGSVTDGGGSGGNLARAFDNITGGLANTLVFGTPWTIIIDYGSGITKNIKHFRMWAMDNPPLNETPLSVEIFGSNDNFASETSLFNGSWLPSEVPSISGSGSLTPSDNLNLSLKKDLSATGDYRYYKFVFPMSSTSASTVYSIGELALYESDTPTAADSSTPAS